MVSGGGLINEISATTQGRDEGGGKEGREEQRRIIK